MTPSPAHPSMTPARRASFLLLVLGGIAGLLGVAMIAAAPSLADAAPPPELKQQLDELRQQMPFDLRLLAIVFGVMLLVYATAAATLGVLLRTAGQVTVIVTLALAALVTALTAINAGAAMVMGVAPSAVLFAGLAVGHGMIVKWMIQTLQRVAPAAVPLPEASRKPPLADYYLPPMPPA